MEAASITNEKAGFTSWGRYFLVSNSQQKLKELVKNIREIGKDDPRKVVHSIKVGLALTLISIFYYINPLFAGLGTATMWAVLTVVVVMDYTVGGTLNKGFNRAFGTFLAGSLGLGAHHLATFAGDNGEPVLISIFVFILAAFATFSRFMPQIKATYDYGVTTFILTFSLVAVSGYRVEDILRLAHQRVSTIAIGVAACLGTSIFVFPVWAGKDLQDLVAANLDKLANTLKGLGEKYFWEKMESESLESKLFLQCYKSVLNSKGAEDSLANFAIWEPGHGRFSFRHPWKQYLKIGAITRHCAYSVEALNAYISTLQQTRQATSEVEFIQNIQAACAEMSSETGMALAQLASAIRDMKWPTAAAQHLSSATAAAGRVMSLVPAEDISLPDALSSATTASLLSEVVRCATDIYSSVEELSRLAKFKRPELVFKSGTVNPLNCVERSPPHVVVDIEKS